METGLKTTKKRFEEVEKMDNLFEEKIRLTVWQRSKFPRRRLPRIFYEILVFFLELNRKSDVFFLLFQA